MNEAPKERLPRRPLPLLHRFVLALAVALVTAELAVRVIDWRAGRDAEYYLPTSGLETSLYLPHPYLGVVLRPGFDRPKVPGTRSYQVHVNSLGMRGAEMQAEKPAGVFRILCVGGSTTFGTGCTEDRLTYPARLEALLNEHAAAGVRYEVGNCGVPGYTSADSLLNLELRLLDLEPDAVLVYHAANDARPIQARGFRSDYSHLRTAFTEPRISALERFLLGNWRTFAWLVRGTHPEEQLGALQTYMMVENFRDLHVPSREGVPEQGLDAYERNLRSLIGIARVNGFELVLQTFAVCPKRQVEGDEHFLATVDAQNRRVRELAAAEGVPLVELAEPLFDRGRLFDDWMHLNDEGSERHARRIVETARAAGLFGL